MSPTAPTLQDDKVTGALQEEESSLENPTQISSE